jgi:solute carrier family 25 (mitochondrial carnitine/acylcarnitine transporter), member 20/29
MTEPKNTQSKFVQVANEFVAGSVGGMFGVSVGHPLDTIRVRLQTQSRTNPEFSSFFDCLKKTMKKERGIRGLYKGMLSPLLGEMGNLAILFGVYGNVKHYFPQEGITGTAISGSIAGFGTLNSTKNSKFSSRFTSRVGQD